MLVKNGKQLDELDISPDDLGYINQLVDDWTTLPFTEIEITDDTFCPDDYTLVYERIWYGMTVACDCKGVKKIKCGDENTQVRCGEYNADMECPTGYTKDRVGCANIGAEPAIR